MFWFFNIALFLASALAAENLLSRKFPKSASRIEDIRPYRSLIGTVIFFIGLFGLIDLLFSHYRFFWRLLSAGVMIGIGFVQGFVNISAIHRSLGLKWDINRRFEQLAKNQETLGIIGLIVVAFNILRRFSIIF